MLSLTTDLTHPKSEPGSASDQGPPPSSLSRSQRERAGVRATPSSSPPSSPPQDAGLKTQESLPPPPRPSAPSAFSPPSSPKPQASSLPHPRHHSILRLLTRPDTSSLDLCEAFRMTPDELLAWLNSDRTQHDLKILAQIDAARAPLIAARQLEESRACLQSLSTSVLGVLPTQSPLHARACETARKAATRLLQSRERELADANAGARRSRRASSSLERRASSPPSPQRDEPGTSPPPHEGEMPAQRTEGATPIPPAPASGADGRPHPQDLHPPETPSAPPGQHQTGAPDHGCRSARRPCSTRGERPSPLRGSRNRPRDDPGLRPGQVTTPPSGAGRDRGAVETALRLLHDPCGGDLPIVEEPRAAPPRHPQ